MSTHTKTSITLKALSVSLVAALIVAAPGPYAMDAAATVIRGKITPVTNVPGSVGLAPIGAAITTTGDMSLNLANPLSQGLPSVGVLPTRTLGVPSSYKTLRPSAVANVTATGPSTQIIGRSAGPHR